VAKKKPTKKLTKGRSGARAAGHAKGTSRGGAAGSRRGAKARPAARVPKPASRAPRPKAARGLLPVTVAVELYDLVCSVEDVLERGLPFGLCEQRAQSHNDARPGHDAQPIRQQT